jgi:hypothetical protein
VAYGHAERTLAAIRLLESQTAELLGSLPWLDAEQSSWLEESAQERWRAVGHPQLDHSLADVGHDQVGRVAQNRR